MKLEATWLKNFLVKKEILPMLCSEITNLSYVWDSVAVDSHPCYCGFFVNNVLLISLNLTWPTLANWLLSQLSWSYICQ